MPCMLQKCGHPVEVWALFHALSSAKTFAVSNLFLYNIPSTFSQLQVHRSSNFDLPQPFMSVTQQLPSKGPVTQYLSRPQSLRLVASYRLVSFRP